VFFEEDSTDPVSLGVKIADGVFLVAGVVLLAFGESF